MRRRYRRRRRETPAEVELNMAAMLDMAFQLLAFFILTFEPSPVESQISLRMPNKPSTSNVGTELKENQDDLFGLQLSVNVFSTPEGELSGIEVGSRAIDGANSQELVTNLRDMLRELIQGSSFDGISLQVASDLNYERMMQVLDVCSRQTLPNGEPMTNISLGTLQVR